MGDDAAFAEVSEKGDLPARPEAEVSVVEVSEQADRLEILYAQRRERRRTMAWLAAVAGVFLVWGILYGTPGYVIATILTVFQIVPVARHVVVSEEIRRAERELDRLLLARSAGGDSGSDSDTPPGGRPDADLDRDP